MNIRPADLQRQFERARKDWPFIIEVERRHGLPPFLLFAVGSRETNLRNIRGDQGHGHGTFQLDDRFHTIPPGFDNDVRAQAEKAAQMLAENFRRCETWKGACARYNSGRCSDSHTTGRDYGQDVTERRQHLENVYGHMTFHRGFQVLGAIRDKWESVGGGRGFLGSPTTNETSTPDGVGRFNHFKGGSIYWTPATGAHVVAGAIRDKWASLGWERGFLAYPLTDEAATPDGVGRYNHFRGGSIYWTPATGAHVVAGAIRDKWEGLDWERGFLGYPLTDETAAADGVGRFNHFQGGSIYWTPLTGAHVVHGVIRDEWASLGSEAGSLGYPTTDVHATPNGQRGDFQGGAVEWDRSTGATEVIGPPPEA
jgi:uncharacterized protein with LGFP repeats